MPCRRNGFFHELAAIVIANNLAYAIALEQDGEIVDHGRENGGRTSRTASTITR
jgi:hypothetical protein